MYKESDTPDLDISTTDGYVFKETGTYYCMEGKGGNATP